MITRELWGALVVIVAMIASGHAIIRRRNPRAALWWVGLIWSLPVAGSILYFLFGINRIERKAIRMRKRVVHLADESKVRNEQKAARSKILVEDLGHLKTLARMMEGVVHLPLTSGNRITPLVNGDNAYPEMLAAIEAAEHSIALSTYIFDNDAAGGFFIDALARASARGVQVRVLIDDVGAGYHWRSVFNELKEHKIRVAYFLPQLAPWRIAYMNLRNHRKILTIDGRIAFSGGINITENHLLKLRPPHPAQDLHFKIEGPVVAQVQEVFRLDWYFMESEELAGKKWFPELQAVGPVMARGVPDGPDEDFEKCRWTFLGALAHARTSVRIVTPYLIWDAPLLSALNLAAMSGVRVDIVLPSNNDMELVHWATQAILWQVLERGCHVWRTPPPFDHTKLMVIDDEWVLFGSSNWDPRSLRLNFEFNVECYDKTLGAQMAQHVQAKIASARPVTLAEVDSRPLPIKFRDGVARLFSPML